LSSNYSGTHIQEIVTNTLKTTVAARMLAIGTIVGVLMSGVPLYAQSDAVIENTDRRPLVGALDKLEAIFGTPINYEDVPYEAASDLEDVSTPQHRASSPGYALLVPRKGHVKIPREQTSGADRMLPLMSLLANYRSERLPGDFVIEEANGIVYVVPKKVLGRNGQERNLSSVMTTPITIPYGQMRVVEAVAAILNATSKATQSEIQVGSLPFSLRDTIEFGANSEPARNALARLFAKAGSEGRLSYRLLYDPILKLYMLNVRRVSHCDMVEPSSKDAAPAMAPPVNDGQFFDKTAR
jgi:hypothetical protein